MKAKIAVDSDGDFYGIRTYCKHCGSHVLPTTWVPEGMHYSSHVVNRPKWTFNGDFENPTFEPSIARHYEGDGRRYMCHSFVTNGSIRYLDDCTHEDAGKVMELPHIVEGGVQ